MLFNSFAFAIFFPVVTLLYFIIPHAYRWLLLLAASCFFYMYYKPVYILILAATITIDYTSGRLMANTRNNLLRKLWLGLSIAGNLGILLFFKYYNFFDGVISSALHYNHPITPLLSFALPIGLSFHTFQAISYTVEVYRKRQEPEKHLGIFALYVLFYPQLVAGPIERPQNLLHQFREKHNFNYSNAVEGMQLIMWGLFKKAVVADRLALVTDRVYWTPEKYSPATTAVTVLFFSIQIYCDFSGYSDMAIGSARVMGFRLMINFDRPYIATSIADFWRRWHISLSTWFRDYVYVPLGGSKNGLATQAINILIVFLLSGLWHGAAVTFIIWGAVHGILYITEMALIRTGTIAAKPTARLPTSIRQLITFSLVTLAWVFFRADGLHNALTIFKKIAALPAQVAAHIHGLAFMQDHPATRWQLLLCTVAIVILVAIQRYHNKVISWLGALSRPSRWAVYYAFLFIILFFGVFGNREFIYFQF